MSELKARVQSERELKEKMQDDIQNQMLNKSLNLTHKIRESQDRKLNKYELKEFINGQTMWQIKKRYKNEERMLQRENSEYLETTFEPKINEKSKKMVNNAPKRDTSKSANDRLYENALTKDERIKDLTDKYDPSFKPKLESTQFFEK